jgi:hypothetical protein
MVEKKINTVDEKRISEIDKRNQELCFKFYLFFQMD